MKRQLVRHYSYLQLLVLLCIICLLFACSSNLGTSDLNDQQDSGNVVAGNANFFANLQPGTVVAKFEVENPPVSMPTFIAYVTMPIPRFGFPRGDGLLPFAVKDIDGTLVPAQVNIVSRYADAAQEGADVVQLMAEVHRDPSQPVDAAVSYEVQYSPYLFDVALPAGNATAAEFLGAMPGQTSEVNTLLANSNAVLLRAADVDGNIYEANLLRGLDDSRGGDFGPVSATYRTVETMRLVQTGSGGSGCAPYPHLFMVHAYFTTLANEKMLKVDLRLSNGTVDKTASSLDDPISGIYQPPPPQPSATPPPEVGNGLFFRNLELHVPRGWNVVQEPVDPSFDNQNTTHNLTHEIIQLVKPRSDGKWIYARHRQIFWRALALMPQGEESRSLDIMQRYGLGFVLPGKSNGVELFSWQNKLSPNFNPTRQRLTNLAHVRSALRNKFNNVLGSATKVDSLLWHMIQGSASSNSPNGSVKYDAMDTIHPMWGEYGGATSGSGIVQGPGVTAVGAANRAAYRVHEIQHRMVTDRHPTAYFDLDGSSATVEEWKNGNNVMVDYYDGVNHGAGDAFHDYTASACMLLHVQSQGQMPWYKDYADSYAQIDTQHRIRWQSNATTLAYLGNSWLAKDDLIRDAELMHLSYHQHNAKNGQPTDLLGAYVAALANPNRGLTIGRAHAWILFGMSAAYSMADDSWRQTKLPYFKKWADTLALAQLDCSHVYDGGNITIKDAHTKILTGTNMIYRAIQQWEEMMLLNGLRAMAESSLRSVDPSRLAVVENAIRRAANAILLSDLSNQLSHGPAGQLALAYMASPHNFFCSLNDVPAPPNDNWHTTFGNAAHYTYHAYGVAYAVTNDATYLQKAAWVKNTTLAGLETWLKNQATSNLENNLNLLAAVRQELGSEIVP